VFDDAEVDYLIDSVLFVADHGHRFVDRYDFDARSGGWQHKDWQEEDVDFSLASSRQTDRARPSTLAAATRRRMYREYLEQAMGLAGVSV
jgi:hypothetical protein